jgi:hypothetical protein
MGETVKASLSMVCCAGPNQMSSRVGDEVAILDLERSIYFGLDPVGARIWELLQQPTALAAVLQAVLAEFEVDEATARVDLLALVDALLEQRLVEVRPGDAA